MRQICQKALRHKRIRTDVTRQKLITKYIPNDPVHQLVTTNRPKGGVILSKTFGLVTKSRPILRDQWEE